MKNVIMFILFFESVLFVIFSTYNYAQYSIKGVNPEPTVWLYALALALLQLATLLIYLLIGNKKRTKRRVQK